jgi:hypothetical protein
MVAVALREFRSVEVSWFGLNNHHGFKKDKFHILHGIYCPDLLL